MDPHKNPYTPGAGARPPRLVGRDAEVKDFEVAFKRLGAGQSARSFVLDGLRSGGRPARELSVRRAGLIEKGLIFNPAGTQLDFTVPQFAAYLRRVHPFDPKERPTRGRPRRA
jgi:hypothetical protein